MLDPERLVGDVATLVSLPEVVVRINQLVEDPTSTAEQIARVVAQDTALTARLLALANSALFGLSRKVDTIGRAIAVLGTHQVRDLTLGLAAARAFNGIPNTLVSMESFWHHSVLCAVAARLIAAGCPHARPESSFVAGLMHDMGQLVLFNRLPDESRTALAMSNDPLRGLALHACEQQLLGFDHAYVGGVLARRWRLPPSLVESIAFHHDPARAQAHPLDVAVVHLANSVAVLAALESERWEDAPAVHPAAWEITGIGRGPALACAAAAGAAVEDVCSVFQLPRLN